MINQDKEMRAPWISDVYFTGEVIWLDILELVVSGHLDVGKHSLIAFYLATQLNKFVGHSHGTSTFSMSRQAFVWEYL